MRMTNTELELLAQAGAIAEQSLLTRDSPEKKLFQAALKLIENPKNWCKGDYHIEERYRTYEYPEMNVTDYNYDEPLTSATFKVKTKEMVNHRYCSLGAIRQAGKGHTGYSGGQSGPERTVLAAIGRVVGMPVHVFNDSVTHAQVIHVWRTAGKENGWL